MSTDNKKLIKYLKERIAELEAESPIATSPTPYADGTWERVGDLMLATVRQGGDLPKGFTFTEVTVTGGFNNETVRVVAKVKGWETKTVWSR